jgi:pSer/pThr/pTyr-binding forkhead associated (FHA) protein
VIQRDKKLYLKDLGSTFGTEINGSQVDSEELVELGSAAAVSMGGEEFMILSGTWVRDAVKRDRIGLLKSIRTGEVKPLTSKRFPLDRSHMWDGEVLSSRLISRRAQTEIECSDGEFLVKDLDSPNGTFLNGEKLTGRAERLYDGDEISVADEKFVFLEISIKKRGYLI